MHDLGLGSFKMVATMSYCYTWLIVFPVSTHDFSSPDKTALTALVQLATLPFPHAIIIQIALSGYLN